MEITPWNLRQVLWQELIVTDQPFFILHITPFETWTQKILSTVIYTIGPGYPTVPIAIWQPFYKFIIFSETTAKYEKRVKYLSILHEAPYDNYFIISTQKFAMNAL